MDQRKYQDTLDWLYRQLPMYQRQGAVAFKKNLDNIQTLLDHLGRPEQSFTSMHIAGTNGKGTVANLLAAVSAKMNWRTGLYTSPHYLDFRERIRVDGKMVEPDFVTKWVADLRAEVQAIQPSFFEMTVAMAFQYFKDREVDLAVVEVGLGGRLDSTNVLLPKLAVITNISFDHQAFLGNTLAKIASEKAGIIKPQIPVVIGKRQAETSPVFEQVAKEKGAPLYYAEELLELVKLDGSQGTRIGLGTKQPGWGDEIWVDLDGPFQLENIRTALAAILIWNRYYTQQVSWSAITDAFAALPALTGYQGRWQQLGEDPLIIADAAHNEGGLRLVMKRLASYEKPLHLVLGFVKDKDLDQILALFPERANYYFAKAKIPRGLDTKDLSTKAAQFGLKGNSYDSVREALSAAVIAAAKDELIFVGGSIFTVAEVLDKDA